MFVAAVPEIAKVTEDLTGRARACVQVIGHMSLMASQGVDDEDGGCGGDDIDENGALVSSSVRVACSPKGYSACLHSPVMPFNCVCKRLKFVLVNSSL
jgi:hypothetical protein